MAKRISKGDPVIVLFLTPTRGLAEIQVHAPPGGQGAGAAFLERLQSTIDRLDRLARGGHPMSRARGNGK